MSSLWLFVIALLFAACEQKSAPLRPAIQKASNAGAEESTADASENSNPASSEKTPVPPPPPGLQLDFLDQRGNLRVLGFKALANKLGVVTGLDANSEAMSTANRFAQSLGAYDYASGVLPESKWTLDKMGAWMRVTDAACRSPSVQAKIQAAGGERAFIETALGRDMNNSDSEMLSELSSKNLPADRRARVLCNAVLLSAEFVSL